ncbi:BON domain-containing protein [Paraburkholderia terrae]|uniref:BON domain-containing protein n=1 Tax=Paraburkholderia terrae TaxID=311230 RepID=UPI001E49FB18|nr:BON domain-containing protein [Paraburkholderia terrae]
MLTDDIEQELLWAPMLDARHVTVHTNGPEVSLTGFVSSHAQLARVRETVRRRLGARPFVCELEVRAPTHREVTDDDLKQAAHTILAWIDGLDVCELTVDSHDGCVVLGGEVDTTRQRDLADAAVRRMRHVASVRNEIVVRQSLLADEVKANIAACMPEFTRLVDGKMAIHARDGVVRLTGIVASRTEKTSVCNAAWDTAGVRWVVDELSLG